MVRIELGKNLYVVIGNSYKIRTSFESAFGPTTENYVGTISGIIDQHLILSRGIVACSYPTWGGLYTAISMVSDRKIHLGTIESILKAK